MKKFFLIAAAFLAATFSASAQDDVQKAAAAAAAAFSEVPKTEKAEAKPQYWTNSLQVDLGFSQTGYTSWAKGGYNTLSLSAGIDARANYARDLMSWNNRLQLQYGFLWTADKRNIMQKSNDIIYLESRWAYKTAKDSRWNYSASYDFRSQFTNSYDSYKQDVNGDWSGTLKSGFFAPAYTNIALGMEWVPNDWFTVNIAPLTGGFTICNIESLRQKYGMKLKDQTLDPAIGSSYENALFQFGAQVKVDFKAMLNDAFKYETQFVLFTDYLNSPFKANRVNWDNKFSWQAAKYFKVAFNTWLIYDPIVLIDNTQKVQFKEFFSIGFTYAIANKK